MLFLKWPSLSESKVIHYKLWQGEPLLLVLAWTKMAASKSILCSSLCRIISNGASFSRCFISHLTVKERSAIFSNWPWLYRMKGECINEDLYTCVTVQRVQYRVIAMNLRQLFHYFDVDKPHRHVSLFACVWIWQHNGSLQDWPREVRTQFLHREC